MPSVSVRIGKLLPTRLRQLRTSFTIRLPRVRTPQSLPVLMFVIRSRLTGFPPAMAGKDALLGVPNAVDPTPVHQAQNEVTFKIDQNFGAKNSLFFRYSMINSTVTGTGGFPNLKRLNEIPARNWGGSYLHVFDPSLILQVQYARTTVADNSSNRFTNIPASVVTAVGFSPTFNGGFTTAGSLIPNVSIGGFSTGGESGNLAPKATDR